jgi:hypothetical protein
MTVQSLGRSGPYEVIRLGGEAAALAAHDEWVAAGRPEGRSHEDVMAELLGGDQ